MKSKSLKNFKIYVAGHNGMVGRAVVKYLKKEGVRNIIFAERKKINLRQLDHKFEYEISAKKIDNEGAYAAKVEISTIKFYVAQVLQNVLDRAVQVHGALGMTDDTPLASLYRHERSARIYDGADEVHKTRVAKEIMKKYLK